MATDTMGDGSNGEAITHALILQGGGALGSYQAGVYQALHEAGVAPDWVAGISIGAINAALIVGNAPERRLERLEEFWERVTRPGLPFFPFEGDFGRKWRGALSAASAQVFGQDGFFAPNLASPWMSAPGSPSATSFYDTSPLARTLSELVEFGRINEGRTRFAVGAVDVESGNFAYFDNRRTRGRGRDTITAAHVMASGALPPGFPAVAIGEHSYWDGGLVSNTPLQHLLENCGGRDMVVFQVDLFSARGNLPQDMYEVMARQKDIQYSSRTRFISDTFAATVRLRRDLRDALALVPDDAMTEAKRQTLIRRHGLDDLPRVSLLQLIYRQAAWESEHKDYEFSRRTMREHWEIGYRDTRATLAHPDWLIPPANGEAIVSHDVHRDEDK